MRATRAQPSTRFDDDVPDVARTLAGVARELPVENHAAADPGTDRQVEESLEPLRAAPLAFGQRGCVDVGVEPRSRRPEA